MIKYLTRIYRAYPIYVWNLVLVAFLFISRKTLFNVKRDVSDGYEAVVDNSTSLAMIGIFLGILYFNSHLKALKHVVRHMWPILLYFAFAWLSAVWAPKGSFSTISFKALENIVNILCVSMMAYYIKDDKMTMLFAILFCVGTTSVALLSAYYKFGFGFYHTNSNTICSMLGMLLCVGCIRHRLFRIRELMIPLAICVYAWITGTSTASYISAIAGFLVLFSSRKKGVNVMAAFLVILISVSLWMLFGDYIYDFIAAGHTKHQMETGTGRDKLWTAAFEAWKTSPWLGNGYIVGETCLANMGQQSAHNSFISVLVNTGIIGEIIFMFCFFKWVIKSYLMSSINIYANISFPAIAAIFVNINSCPVLGSHWSFVTDSILIIMAATFINFTGVSRGDRRTINEMMNSNRRKI